MRWRLKIYHLLATRRSNRCGFRVAENARKVAHPRCGRCSARTGFTRRSPVCPTGQTTQDAIARDGEYPDDWSASETETFLAAAERRAALARARAHARQRERAVGPVPRKEAYSTEREEVLLLRCPGPGGDRDATRAACNFVGQVATRARSSPTKNLTRRFPPSLSLSLSPLLSFPRTKDHSGFNTGIEPVFTIDKTSTRAASLRTYVRPKRDLPPD